MAFKKWREKGESFRVDRYTGRCIEGRCLHQIMPVSAKTKKTLKVTKTKTALKQKTYNLSDLPVKHDLHCGSVELGDPVSVSQ